MIPPKMMFEGQEPSTPGEPEPNYVALCMFLFVLYPLHTFNLIEHDIFEFTVDFVYTTTFRDFCKYFRSKMYNPLMSW